MTREEVLREIKNVLSEKYADEIIRALEQAPKIGRIPITERTPNLIEKLHVDSFLILMS